MISDMLSFSGLAFILIGLYLSLTHRTTKKVIAGINIVADALMLVCPIGMESAYMVEQWGRRLVPEEA